MVITHSVLTSSLRNFGLCNCNLCGDFEVEVWSRCIYTYFKELTVSAVATVN
jgi:hypothetical protein